jgi:hypothetical protein
VIAALVPVFIVVALVVLFIRNFLAVAGVWRGLDAATKIGAVALLAAWLIYRAGQAATRDGVIRSLRTELDLHKSWVGREWPKGKVAEDGSWDLPWYSVFRLSTVATDNSITQGPSLFLSQELVLLVVRYRQMLEHLNQLIENSSAFQVELARGVWPDYLVSRIRGQTQTIHWEGIGDRRHRTAHFYFYQTCQELDAETKAPISFCAWLLTGLRTYTVERFIYRSIWRLSDYVRHSSGVVAQTKVPLPQSPP